MTLSLIDVVKVDAVLLGDNLLANESAITSLRKALDLDDLQIGRGLATQVSTGETAPSITVSINRERVTVDVLPNRLAVAKEYPSRADLSRLAEVVRTVVDCSSLPTDRSVPHGYNIEMLYRCDGQTAAAFISEHLLMSMRVAKDGWTPIGNNGRVVYQHGERQWTFSVEPRFNDPQTPIVYVAANLHIDSQPPPTTGPLSKELDTVWEEAQEFVGRLSRSVD